MNGQASGGADRGTCEVGGILGGQECHDAPDVTGRGDAEWAAGHDLVVLLAMLFGSTAVLAQDGVP